MIPANIKKVFLRGGIISLTVFGLLIAVMSVKPGTAHAQLGGAACNSSFSYSNTVPVYDKNTQALKDVKCTWDGIAWQMAQVVLQELTTSVVNWINSGFNGNPSFLTNPQGFFLDAADQATGAFIDANGPLKGMCSPFSLDIRLSLALSQTPNNIRYTCTLGTILKNSRQGGGINVTVDQSPNGATIGDLTSGNVLNKPSAASVNGASVDSFLAGNFSQGGVSGFLGLTTEPQNNAFGASLQAQSDLQMQILAKQNSINNDLNRGNGFLSWQKCDTVADPAVSGDYGDEINAGGKGKTKQVCHTETPGSVISASLNKQIGAPTDRLNLTNSINQVVSALFAQLMSRVLSKGLYASSQTSSAGSVSQSYANQLSHDQQLQGDFTTLKQQAVADFQRAASGISQVTAYRTQALSAVKDEQTAYVSVRACIAAKVSATEVPYEQTYLQNQLAALDSAIATNVNPQVVKYQGASDAAMSANSQITDMVNRLQQASTPTQLASLSNEFTAALTTQSATATDIQAAKTDLATAQATAKSLHSALAPYQATCGN